MISWIENNDFAVFKMNEEGSKYWRTKSGAEVDIILEIGREIIPIEVKTTIPKLKVGRGFRSFIERYGPRRGFVVGLDVERNKTRISKCEMSSITIPELLEELEKIRSENLKGDHG
ncbi:MAG: DUF4143 domain-containing protein [Thermoplasmatota archaeon]